MLDIVHLYHLKTVNCNVMCRVFVIHLYSFNFVLPGCIRDTFKNMNYLKGNSRSVMKNQLNFIWALRATWATSNRYSVTCHILGGVSLSFYALAVMVRVMTSFIVSSNGAIRASPLRNSQKNEPLGLRSRNRKGHSLMSYDVWSRNGEQDLCFFFIFC